MRHGYGRGPVLGSAFESGQKADKTDDMLGDGIQNARFIAKTSGSAKPLCVGSIPTRASNFSAESYFNPGEGQFL
jgi:hypothetical protein